MYDDDDLNEPLATDSLPPRDEQGRFTAKDDAPPAEDTEAADQSADESVPAEEPVAEEPAATEEPPVEEPVAEEPPAEEPVEEPVEDDKSDKLAKQKVPYERFKQAVEKERAKKEQLERELQSLRSKLDEQDSVEVTEEELNALGDLLIEGKTQDYAKGMKDILEKVFQKGVITATERAKAVAKMETTEERIARERVEAATRWQAEYPEFDPNSEVFDEDLLMEAVALRDAYESQGFSPSAAIERAVKRLAPAREAPAPAPAPAPKPRPSTVPQKMQTAQAQPPMPSGHGEPDKPVSLLDRIAQMTDEEFDALSESDLEKIRRGVKL